ncbi:MAG TPA: tetratricopeptide repeat protein [Gemmatimonadaceae bacterium]|nr:tetratricopeptide repeat protein [Gemmatimonadaceae bacterium]
MTVRTTIALLLAGAGLPAAAQQPTRDSTSRPPDTAARATAAAAAPATATFDTSVKYVVPQPDQPRAIDIELRMALYDLTQDRPLSALSRLEWLRSVVGAVTTPAAPPGAATPVAARPGGDTAAAPAGQAPAAARAPGADSAGATATAVPAPAQSSYHTRNDLLFLLAQTYYRLAMMDEFRATAQELLNAHPDSRYAEMIRSQLMLDAYRRGDYAKVQELAGTAEGFGDRPLISLVIGLAAFQRQDWPAAHTAFQASRAAGGPYAPYAQYMDALTTLGGDSTKMAVALDSLRPLTKDTTALGDQAKVTAAELSHQLGRYDEAAAFAGAVPPTSGVAAQAQLTRAWALYRGGKLDSASASFADFAKRYPELPQRDEARLMIGQLMLEAKRPDLADTYFQAVADSIGDEVTALQPRTTTSMTDASRALVSARLAGLAFVSDPPGGKTLVAPDALGAHPSLLLAAFEGQPMPPATTAPAPDVLTLPDIEKRLSVLSTTTGADFPQRVLFTPPSSPQVTATYIDRSQALNSADLNVALAGYRLTEGLAVQRMRVFSLLTMQELLAAGNENIVSVTNQGDQIRDSLVRMNAHLDSARVNIRAALYRQVRATQAMAEENQRLLDSTRQALGPAAVAADSGLIATERQTADAYRQLALIVGGGVDSAIAHHPVFARRDSVTKDLRSLRDVRDQAQTINTENAAVVTAELARLQGPESDRVRAQRATLAAAEQRQANAEAQLISLLDAELRARSAGLVALLNRDREAADYGSASAAFFRAIDAGAGGTPGSSVASPTTTAGPAPGSTPPRR